MINSRKHFTILIVTVITTLLLVVFAQPGSGASDAAQTTTTTPSPAGATGQSAAIYTSEQATAGQQVIAQVCSVCHGDNLQGGVGPALVGTVFSQSWEQGDKTVEDLYSFISTNMPQNAPGSLTPQQYIDAVAYILQQNQWPAGAEALTTDSTTLSAIKLTVPAAP